MGKLVPDHGEKQIVTFIFDGGLDPARVAEWNELIKQLKEKFGNKVKAATVKASEKKKPKSSKKPRSSKSRKPSARRRRKSR